MEKKLILSNYHLTLKQMLGQRIADKNIALFLNNIVYLLECFKNFDIQVADKQSIMIYNCCSTLIGASLGDSMGSYCEFTDPNETNCYAIWNGINPIFSTAKGQLTDDTEMANSMALGILESLDKFAFDYSNPSEFKINFIAYYYSYWFESGPFDIGNTTRNALSIGRLGKYCANDITDNSLISEMSENSKELNNNSLSNGFLMRHTPMTALLYYISEMNEEKPENVNFKRLVKEKRFDELFLFLLKSITNEIRLTHYNYECVVAAAIYDFLIINILTNKTDQNYSEKEEFNFNSEFYLDLLIEFLLKLLESEEENIRYLKQYLEKILNNLMIIYDMKNFQESKTIELLKVGEKNIGYYMHAINLIFFIIKFYSDFSNNKGAGTYRNIINFICNKGGDTDTNCCIVGAVFGAIVGIKNIETEYLETHLKFNPVNKNNLVKRPFLYAPSVLTFYGIKLFSMLNKQTIESNEKKESEGPFSSYSSISMIDKILTKDLESEAKNSFELAKISELI